MGLDLSCPGFGLDRSTTEDLLYIEYFLLEYLSPLTSALGAVFDWVWALCYKMFPSLCYVKHKS